MTNKLLLSILCVFSLFFAQAQDTIRLDNASSFIITQKTHSGSFPKAGDIITMRLKKYSPEGILLFSTNEINSSKGVQVTLTNDTPSGDILDVFHYLKRGEKALAYIPTWLADRDSSARKSNELYSFEIELIDFITQKELKKSQRKLLKQLKKDQHHQFDSIANALQPNYHIYYKKNGLLILKKEKSKTKRKDRIQSQQEVSVHYILNLLPDMQELDNSYKRATPLKIKVDNKQVIKGWDIALKQLATGDKAIILVPSWLAYGFTGTGQDIKPNTPLYFHIEVLK